MLCLCNTRKLERAQKIPYPKESFGKKSPEIFHRPHSFYFAWKPQFLNWGGKASSPSKLALASEVGLGFEEFQRDTMA